jgi:hypothetical protein
VHYCYSGYEGCTAKALHILGFGNTVSEVAASLNACIAPVHAEFQVHCGERSYTMMKIIHFTLYYDEIDVKR